MQLVRAVSCSNYVKSVYSIVNFIEMHSQEINFYLDELYEKNVRVN